MMCVMDVTARLRWLAVCPIKEGIRPRDLEGENVKFLFCPAKCMLCSTKKNERCHPQCVNPECHMSKMLSTVPWLSE